MFPPTDHHHHGERHFGRRHHESHPAAHGRVERHHPEHGPFGSRAGAGPRGRGRGHARGRAHRGDVRTAALLLLAEQPMHGYQLMQAIAERTSGAWRPSPGAIYPTLNQLQDEGMVSTVNDGGRKLATLTEAGREYLAAQGEALADPFADFTPTNGATDLRGPLGDLAEATRQVSRTGNDVQAAAAQKVLIEARRSLYLILAEDPGALGTTS